MTATKTLAWGHERRDTGGCACHCSCKRVMGMCEHCLYCVYACVSIRVFVMLKFNLPSFNFKCSC